MRSLLLIASLVVPLAGCSGFWADVEANAQIARTRQAMFEADINALPPAARLECQMHGQMAAASASNPRALVDLYAAAAGAQVTDTCLRMQLARYPHEPIEPASSTIVTHTTLPRVEVAHYNRPLTQAFCADPTVTNPHLLAECRGE